MMLSDWVLRMQFKNSDPFNEEIILLYLLFLYLTSLRYELSKLITMRVFCTGQHMFEMSNS